MKKFFLVFALLFLSFSFVGATSITFSNISLSQISRFSFPEGAFFNSAYINFSGQPVPRNFFFLSNNWDNWDLDLNATHMWIVESEGQIAEYLLNGTETGFSFTAEGGVPRGVVNLDGFFYVTNHENYGRVEKYYLNGTFIEDVFNTSMTVESISANSTNFFIADTQGIHTYLLNGSYVSNISVDEVGSPLGVFLMAHPF